MTTVQATEEFITISTDQAMQNMCSKWRLSQLWEVLSLYFPCAQVPPEVLSLRLLLAACFFCFYFTLHSKDYTLREHSGCFNQCTGNEQAE